MNMYHTYVNYNSISMLLYFCTLSTFTEPPPLTVNSIKNNESLSIIVQWDAVDAITYTVTWTDDRDLDEVDTVDEQTSYTITGLTLDTVYTITVTAANECGDGLEFKTRITFSSGPEFGSSLVYSVNPTIDTTIITVATTTTARAVTTTTISTTTTNNVVTTPSSSVTSSLPTNSATNPATNFTRESNSKFEKYINIIQNCCMYSMYVHKLYTSTYVRMYIHIYNGKANMHMQSWESYFLKVLYYILLFTFCKSNALQLHVT